MSGNIKEVMSLLLETLVDVHYGSTV